MPVRPQCLHIYSLLVHSNVLGSPMIFAWHNPANLFSDSPIECIPLHFTYRSN